jgi:hypothetical protein
VAQQIHLLQMLIFQPNTIQDDSCNKLISLNFRLFNVSYKLCNSIYSTLKWVTSNCWVWKIQQCCSSWHKPVRLAHTTIPRSKALKSFVLIYNHGLHRPNLDDAGPIVRPAGTSMGHPITADCDTSWIRTRMPVVTPLALRHGVLDHCATQEPQYMSQGLKILL